MKSIFWDIMQRSPVATWFHAGILLGLSDPEDGGNMLLRNVGYFQRTTRRYIPEDSTLEDL
jgi:hypothetical protein